MLKLNGLGWIEYTLPFTTAMHCAEWQPSIELKDRSIVLVCLIEIRNKSFQLFTYYLSITKSNKHSNL